MKPVHLLVSSALIVIGAAAWFIQQVGEAASLRRELESLRAENLRRASTVGEANAPRAADEEAALLEQQIADLRRELAREAAEVKTAETSLEEVRQKLPPMAEGETIVSLGRITDMGKEAAQAIRGIAALLRGEQDAGIDQEQIQASFMKLIAWMPEITDFEERPAEMASFQAALFRELFGLDEPRARQMEGIIKTHFEMLHAARLTAANSQQPTWQERRTAALAPLLWQLRPFLPPNFQSPEMLGQVVNVGAGLETKTETHFSNEPGKSVHSVSMTLPSWPRLPWLPPKEKASK